MKRLDLVKELERAGGVLPRNGARHDLYRNPVSGAMQPVPRHREIGEALARRILRDLTAPPAPDQA